MCVYTHSDADSVAMLHFSSAIAQPKPHLPPVKSEQSEEDKLHTT